LLVQRAGRIVIIGAGFAGLAAATELANRDYDVLVLEARNRVGGRVWSDTIEAPGGGRATIERGAEYVLDGYTELRRLAVHYGLALRDMGMSYYVREPHGIDATTTDLQAAGRAVAKAAEDDGSGSVADVVQRLDLEPDLADAVLCRIEISCAQQSELLSPRVLEHVAAFEPLPSERIGGGNQGLAIAMSNQLGERLRLDSPVRAIDDGVVRTDGGDVPADHVLLTIPLPLARTLPISPGLPDWKRRALDRREFGHAAKLHVPLAAPTAPSAVMSVRERYWGWTATEEDGIVAPVLSCFAGSPGALAELGVQNGIEDWLDSVVKLRHDLELDRTGALLTTWDDDEWAQGAYCADGLRQEPGDDDALARSVGRLHFAGEHTAGPWSGLMEGALRSGLRAAHEIAADTAE
jgi:monoamine oxidase